ncbi:MAG: flagellar protein [Peptococcaceae bacterium]|nr:flagellar protein [Peptococcaceae bacterium]
MPRTTPGSRPVSKGVNVGEGDKGKKISSGISFGNILSAELGKGETLKISAHAEKRLLERNVTLNSQDMLKIEDAVNKAASKGSRESLVIYGDIALVASIRNKTIITAMEGKDMQEHIFTNIDSAVIVSMQPVR